MGEFKLTFVKKPFRISMIGNKEIVTVTKDYCYVPSPTETTDYRPFCTRQILYTREVTDHGKGRYVIKHCI